MANLKFTRTFQGIMILIEMILGCITIILNSYVWIYHRGLIENAKLRIQMEKINSFQEETISQIQVFHLSTTITFLTTSFLYFLSIFLCTGTAAAAGNGILNYDGNNDENSQQQQEQSNRDHDRDGGFSRSKTFENIRRSFKVDSKLLKEILQLWSVWAGAILLLSFFYYSLATGKAFNFLSLYYNGDYEAFKLFIYMLSSSILILVNSLIYLISSVDFFI